MNNLDKKNYFQRFDLEESFNIDLEILEEKYLSAQSEFHPDKLIDKSHEERVNSEMNSILLNEAYEVLKDALARAIYFFKVKVGIDINNDASCKIKPSQKILLENLELRELIFETESKEILIDLRKKALVDIKQILKLSKSDFINKKYDECAMKLIEARYIDKTISEIKRKIIKLS